MVDPIKNLPKEVNSSLFSLLPTTQIALCNAVSKDWRSNLLNDSIVNRVLDLDRPGNRLSEDQIIDLVQRLASNSSHPQRELLLDIRPFFKSFQEYHEMDNNPSVGELMRHTFYKFPNLIHSISSATRGRLSKLSLSAYSAGNAPSYLAIAIIETTLLLKDSLEDLREIYFFIPTALRLVSQGPKETDGSPRRRITLRGIRFSGNEDWHFVDCLHQILEFNGFTKGSLFSLDLPFERSRDVGRRVERLGEFKALVETIQQSQHTLTRLRLGLIVEHEDSNLQPGYVAHVWDMVKSLSKLKELECLYPEGFSEDPGDQLQSIVPLVLPQGNDHPALKLKDLTFSLASATLEWELDPLHWFGSSLETLYLQFGSKKMHLGVIPEIPSNHLASFLNLQSTLRFLELEYLFTSNPDQAVKIDLPNLRDLKLNFLSLKAHQTFNKASLPKLRTLKIQFPQSPEERILGQDETGLCLPILTATRLWLQRIEIKGSLGTVSSSSHEPLLFPCLISVVLDATSSNIVELFSKFQYEELSYLTISGESLTPNVIYDLLVSCSSTLKDFTPDWKMPMEEASNIDPSQSLSFPNYTDLYLSSKDPFLFNLFLHASLPNLTSLTFVMGGGLKALVTFLEKTSTTLEELIVESCDSTSEEIGPDIESFRGIKIYLPALERFSTTDCPSALVQLLFTCLSFSGIDSFALEISDSISTELQSKILELMINDSSTLRRVSFQEGDFEVDENEVGKDVKKVKMRQLEWLEVSGEHNQAFTDRLFSQFQFPRLETLAISGFNEDQESKTQRALWRSSLKVFAPQLKKFTSGRPEGYASIPFN